jgi:hypothetical protein
MGTLTVETPTRATSQFADLAKLAEHALLASITDGSLELYRNIADKMASLRAELAGPEPIEAPLRLIIEATVIAWLQYWVAEIDVATARKSGGSRDLDRRLAWAQRRYLQSLQAVETIRRLARRPMYGVAIQINQNRLTPPAVPFVELAQPEALAIVSDPRKG